MVKLTTLFIISLCLNSIAKDLPKETIRFASGEFPPYLSNELKHQGLYAKILEDIFADTEMKIEINFFPWNRAMFLVKTGKYEASPMWIKNKEREKEFHFSVPITFNEKVFFHLKTSNFEWDKIEDIKKYQIAITQNYTYGKTLDQWAEKKSPNITIVPEDHVKFKMLIQGRIEAFPMDLETGLYLAKKYLNKEEQKRLTYNKKTLIVEGMRVMFSKKMDAKKRKKAMKIIEDKIQKLKQDGSIDKYFWNLRNGTLFN